MNFFGGGRRGDLSSIGFFAKPLLFCGALGAASTEHLGTGGSWRRMQDQREADGMSDTPGGGVYVCDPSRCDTMLFQDRYCLPTTFNSNISLNSLTFFHSHPGRVLIMFSLITLAISPSDIEQIVSDESKDATTPKPGMKALDTTQVFSESPKAISDIPLPSTTQPETPVPEVQTANPSSVPLPTPDSAQPVVSITPAAQTTSVDTRNLESTSKDKAGVLLPKLEKTKTKIKEEDTAGRGSWFGSWSRRKGKEVKEGQDVKRNKDGQETATPLPQAQVGIEQNKLVGSGERMREVIDLTGDGECHPLCLLVLGVHGACGCVLQFLLSLQSVPLLRIRDLPPPAIVVP